MLNSTKRGFIIGAGSLGIPLFEKLSQGGRQFRLLTRPSSGDRSTLIKDLKNSTKDNLHAHPKYDVIFAETVEDYQKVFAEEKPYFMVITIPQPDPALLNYLLSVENCFKVYISSPAADFARACPDKVKPGSYPYDKCRDEDLVNIRGVKFGDALAVQIGFIPEMNEIFGSPIPSGLSQKTMLGCLLTTGFYDSLIDRIDEIDNKTGKPVIRTVLDNFKLSKGFTCTSIDSLYRLLGFLYTEESKQTFKGLGGNTIAYHSSQVWEREKILNAMQNANYRNDGYEFYGAKSPQKISQPVMHTRKFFGDRMNVTHDDIMQAIIETKRTFEANQETYIQMYLEMIRGDFDEIINKQ